MTLIAWIVILPAVILALLCGAQVILSAGEDPPDYHAARESAVAGCLAVLPALVGLAVAGVLAPMATLILATFAALGAVGGLWYEQGVRTGHDARLGVIMGDVAAAWRLAHLHGPARATVRRASDGPGGGTVEGTIIPPGVSRPRPVPSVAADPGLRTPLADEASISPAGMDPLWAALCSFVSGFEAEDAHEFLAFFAGQVAGILAYAEAMGGCAENHGEGGAGYDPGIVQAAYEFGDMFGDLADAAAMVRRRFIQTYGDILGDVENGLVLPHNAREQFGDGSAGTPPAAA